MCFHAEPPEGRLKVERKIYLVVSTKKGPAAKKKQNPTSLFEKWSVNIQSMAPSVRGYSLAFFSYFLRRYSIPSSKRSLTGRLVYGRGEVLSVFLWGSKSMDNMTSEELTKALEQVLKATDRETQLKVLRALMRYQNIDGLDLEEDLEQELKL
jgi:hypothetical protein